MEELNEIRKSWIERAEELKNKAGKEPNKLKAKDMRGLSKGYLDCANQIKNYLKKKGINCQ